MLELLVVLLFGLAWVGHACICTSVLNNLYGRRFPKGVLKPVRYLTGLAILAFPLVAWAFRGVRVDDLGWTEALDAGMGVWALAAYCVACLYFGLVFPVTTLMRYLRKPPACVVSEQTRTLDLWPELGQKLVGNGKFRPLTKVPGNGVFKLDVTDLTLALPNLPREWEGLTILHVTDLHFHGTPSREYFDRVFAELAAGPVPDVVCLTGDFVDTDTHREWIQPLLGRLHAKEAKLAILGNHDKYHEPDAIRSELTAAGYTVLSNAWREIALRGVPCVAVGHEGPWFDPAPDLAGAPTTPFRLCLSHTPDNFYWGQSHGINLMLCGHVHGGGIRVPVIGSIFVPSVYGRRFDQGVFSENGLAMVVSRGISGKEPIRIRCNPQVIRLTLVRPAG